MKNQHSTAIVFVPVHPDGGNLETELKKILKAPQPPTEDHKPQNSQNSHETSGRDGTHSSGGDLLWTWFMDNPRPN